VNFWGFRVLNKSAVQDAFSYTFLTLARRSVGVPLPILL
jgi:hypothetical protein